MSGPSGTSFIPKKTVQKLGGAPVRRKRFYVISFIASVLFFVSLLLAAGVFFYKNYAEGLLQEQKVALENERNGFDQSDIESVRDLEHRITASEKLLADHTAVSQVFSALEESTGRNVQYVSFSYTQLPSGSLSLELGGIAPSFNSVMVQKEAFEDSVLFSEGIISDVSFGIADNSSEDEAGDAGTGGERTESISFLFTILLPQSQVAYTAPTRAPVTNETVTSVVEGEVVEAEDAAENDGADVNQDDT